jgi:hypothetical protein
MGIGTIEALTPCHCNAQVARRTFRLGARSFHPCHRDRRRRRCVRAPSHDHLKRSLHRLQSLRCFVVRVRGHKPLPNHAENS